MYENFFNLELIEASLPDIFQEDKLCWIATIFEIEILLCTYKNDKKLALDAINRLIKSKSGKHMKPLSLLSIIDDMKLYENMPFIEEMNYWDISLKNLACEIN